MRPRSALWMLCCLACAGGACAAAAVGDHAAMAAPLGTRQLDGILLCSLGIAGVVTRGSQSALDLSRVVRRRWHARSVRLG